MTILEMVHEDTDEDVVVEEAELEVGDAEANVTVAGFVGDGEADAVGLPFSAMVITGKSATGGGTGGR